MPRRPAVSCRQFRQLHAEFVDGFLCEEQTQAMLTHGDRCPACSMHDVQVRRSLLALQALPRIEPSADFRERLYRRLCHPQLRRSRSAGNVGWGMAMDVSAAVPMARLQLANFRGH